MTRAVSSPPSASQSASSVVWSFPTRIVYGIGSHALLGRELEALGVETVLVVSDRGVTEAGVLNSVMQTLANHRLRHLVYDGVQTNPQESHVTEAVALFRTLNRAAVVSIGGGASIDVGKLVRVLAAHNGLLKQYDERQGGTQRIANVLPPMVAIPTTAGTGSEVTTHALITLDGDHIKTRVRSERLMPTVAILDPILTQTLNEPQTASTGFEALTRSIEGYCAPGDHPMAEAIALEAASLVYQYFERAVYHNDDLEARGAMLKAAMMGGVASQKGAGVCQAMAQVLAAEFNIHYGLASAMCLPSVLEFYRSIIPVKIAHMSRILGAKGTDIETLAFECSGVARQLRRKVGLPEGLSDIGVAESNIDELAAIASDHPDLGNTVRSVTREDIASLYRSSF